jgi:nucleoside-diphosphate-sugar epimerase
MNRRVLITGAEGFIGEQLRRELLRRNFFVRSLVRQSTEKSVDIWNVDLAADNFPSAVCNDIDIVFHLAGKAHSLAENRQDLAEYRHINTEGTRKLLEAAKLAGVKCFVFFSSVKAAGDCEVQPMDETTTVPADSPYGQSKYEAEQLVLNGGFVPHPVVIRPCMVYGNTDKGNLPRMIEAVRRGLFPPLPELRNRRSMVHVDDVVAAALLAAEKSEAAGQIYIVSDGQNYSTRQLYELIRAALGKSPIHWAIPLFVLKILAKIGDAIGRLRGRRFMFDSDALRKLTGSAWYSSAKIGRELGFQPQHSLRQSLPDIVRFLNKK